MLIAFGLTLTDYRDFVDVGQFWFCQVPSLNWHRNGMTYVPA
jgi:hypothetical protein